MSSEDQIQQSINRLSLIMQVSEDIVKAAKQSDTHPLMLEVLLKLHNTQVQQEEELKQLRTQILTIAKLSDHIVDGLGLYQNALAALADNGGLDIEKLIKPANVDDQGH